MLECCLDATDEEAAVQFLPLVRQHADPDPRTAVVETQPDEPLPVILHLDDVAVVRGVGHAEDGALIEPGMTRNETVGFAGLENDGGQ